MKAARPERMVLVAGVAIVAAGLAAYRGSFSGPFVLDDLPSILDNATLHLWPLAGPVPPHGGA